MAMKHLASNAHNDISITRINCLLNWDVEQSPFPAWLGTCVKSGVNQTFSSQPKQIIKLRECMWIELNK